MSGPPTVQLVGAGTGFTDGSFAGAVVGASLGYGAGVLHDHLNTRGNANSANQQEAGQSGASNVGNSSIPLDTLKILNSTRVIPVNPTNST
ncbi:unnamed protein product [Rhizophagus irregularis]|uniref:Uncharacterized protein n=1 Tax=Rhizophagus irregularis TaxID=588596 RepID=A0A2N1M4Y3_9GLOM|nr:hypothetical protein RhiirC2_799462 [Rhizophagus irregularis]CAB5393647.1 unnamed protein product [Rhizophagus irregularis]